MPNVTNPANSRPVRIRSGRLRKNAQRWSWVFMRISGVVLIMLIFTHLFVNLVDGDGIKQIDFAFVAGKWAQPIWKVWDLTMLVLAMLHGGNGMRLLIEDYARHRLLRRVLLVALAISVILVVVLGSLVIFTFDPCPVGALAQDLPSFCADVR